MNAQCAIFAESEVVIDSCENETRDISKFDSLNALILKEEAFASRQRVKVPELDLSSRHQGFQEVASGYADESAVREAKRCLQCDLRLYMGCNPSPPEKIVAFKEGEHPAGS